MTLTRRTFLAGSARLAVGAATTAPIASSSESDPRVLAAYLRFLDDEHRILAYRVDRAGLWPFGAVPCGTGVDQFHAGHFLHEYNFPDSGPNEAPEDRAPRMLRAAGVDLDAMLRRSRWRPIRTA